jgi:hypothetical protein
MEKKSLFSTYIDVKKGKVPIVIDMAGDLKKGSIKVKIKPRRGKLELKNADLKLIEELGNGYVENARDQLMLQAMYLGMTTFAERFPLVSIAISDPNLYMSNLFVLLVQGLKRRNLQTFMALIDTAYKAKDGVLPDPLPNRLKNKIKLAQYKSWGNDVSKKLNKLTKDFSKGLLMNDFFSEMNTKDLGIIIKSTEKVADYYSKQAMK